jgi:hypothetical protein
MRSPAIVATLILAGGGCGGDEERPRLPLVVDVGGPKLAHPQLVFIYYANDLDARDGFVDYSRGLVASSWLEAVGAEYGIGAGSVLAVVEKPTSSPAQIDDREIVDLLFAGLADGSLPAPTADTLYMFTFPNNHVTYGSSTACVEFRGYHDSARRNGVEVAYAVIPTCRDSSGVAVSRATTISHELIEAATDPFPGSNPGWQLRDLTSPWLAMGDEVADLCVRGGDSGVVPVGEHQAQRSWSNAAAGAERDPCVPHRYGETYFNAVLDTKTILRIRPGYHRTIRLEGFATKDVDSWILSVRPALEGTVTLTLGELTLEPGKSTTLDITLPSSARVGVPVFSYVYSELGAAANYQWHYLPVPVMAGEPCSTFTDCQSCTSRAGCGFCSSSGRCEAIGVSGSAESSCEGSSFATWAGSCPGLCENRSASCTTCTAAPGCGWCAGGTPACMEASHAYSHPEVGTCAYADWSIRSSYCPGS